MSDLISRADAIKALSEYYEYSIRMVDEITDLLNSLPSVSAELPKGDLISRADVLKYPIRLDHYDEVNGSREFVYGVESVIEYVEALPSADRPITSGYIADDKEVPPYTTTSAVSADRPSGEWLMFDGLYCSNCHYKLQTTGIPTYCPSCGAFMKGGAE